MHRKLDVLQEKGFVVLRDYDGPPIPESEWLSLEYLDWKSGGDSNFAPIASAEGELECAGFWDHGKSDKDGKWTSNRARCPTLASYVEAIGANFGRVRIIKLHPSDAASAMGNMHVDDNNRLNPAGEGWVVRTWLNLSDDPGSCMILREAKDDPSTESRISMPRGRQIVVDTERLWHVVHHVGDGPRYSLITSFESGDALDAWIKRQLPVEAPAG